jgi:hypothetical protein
MNKDFIPYQEALELKQLGFDEPCFAWYHLGDTLLSDITMGYEKTDFLYTQDDMEETQCTAPTYSQAFRWFREKYNLYCFTLRQVGINTSDIFFISSYYKGKKGNSSMNTCIPSETYEEAELACLREMIKIVK